MSNALAVTLTMLQNTSSSSVSDIYMYDLFCIQNSELTNQPFRFFSQFHSWSALQVTYDGFVRILKSYCVPSSFLYFVHAFGEKVDDVDIDIGGCMVKEFYSSKQATKVAQGVFFAINERLKDC
jgi:hypothetical protein